MVHKSILEDCFKEKNILTYWTNITLLLTLSSFNKNVLSTAHCVAFAQLS